MVVTKHFATHGEKYRRRLIKYILNPDKTNNLKLVSDFGISNYLDFPTYDETVEMYNTNFLNNDTLYNFRNDRQEKHQQKIHAHHLIQSFSPDDNLSPEEVNRIGYETIQELTGGQFRFIVATHKDKSHLHNHIVINSIDINSDKKFKWDYAQERNFRMISDRISKIAGAKIIENRYSYRDYEVYKKSNHKFELKQRLYFLMQQSDSFENFLKKADRLHVKIDFTRKYSRFLMTDRDMKQVIRGNKLSKRDLYDEEFFRTYFAKQDIEKRLEFLLDKTNSIEELLLKARELNLTIDFKQKNVTFTLEENGQRISLNHKKISNKKLYDIQFFQSYFGEKNIIMPEEQGNLQEHYRNFKEEQEQKKVRLDEIESAYEEFKKNRDAVHEFEVELAPNQIEKLVDEGIYIKVSFGIKQNGIIFIPNYQLDMIEEDDKTKYKVYIRETTSYFVYNKESSDKDRYIKGRTLIRQLTQDSQKLPYSRATVASIQQKISEINLLIELNTSDKNYHEMKNEFVTEIAELDIRLDETQETIAILNKMAEVFINLKSNNQESRKLARYDFAKLNLSESATLEKVNQDMIKLQEQFSHYLNDYEDLIRRLETYVEILNQHLGKPEVSEERLVLREAKEELE
ncbi:Relaxase/mobilization nuclease family protein [Streptococcus milleri]|uniref:Relaxase/mobilization nuclease family protein n=3 Tax=Streptococcus milleri TaxID=33040 RepID=A0A380L4Q9_9STRE|nr:SAG1250 family conjugative relaxase [Streptococcus milleri]SUN80090.1 Relaxase/mobilization nuclease family protein [Streptococcus milleri]